MIQRTVFDAGEHHEGARCGACQREFHHGDNRYLRPISREAPHIVAGLCEDCIIAERPLAADFPIHDAFLAADGTITRMPS